MSFHRLLYDGLVVIILIVSAIGIYRFKSLSKEIRIIVYFVFLGAFTELFTDFYKANIAQNTMPIGHFYYTVSIIMMCLFYQKVLAGYIKIWLINALLLLFLGFAIINVLFIQSINDFPNMVGSLGALLLIVFSILFFAKIMTEANIKSLRKEPLVWINIGILFYYSGHFFYFILFNLNVKNAYEFAKQVVDFMAFLNIAFYILLAISFFLTRKHKNFNQEAISK